MKYSQVGPEWEDDAEAAIQERYRGMQIATFWTDLGNFFTTGVWGKEGQLFETQFANAKDEDAEGTDGYFSSSNRLIALINEAFRLSLSHGRIQGDAQALAEQSIPDIEAQFRNSAEHGRPADVAEEDYKVTVTVAQDPNFDADQNFIYESCYLLSAASAAENNTDGFAFGVRDTLDFAFSITGLDNVPGEKICWKANVRPAYDTTIITETPISWTVRDEEGNEIVYTDQSAIPEDAEIISVETKRSVEVKAYAYYSAQLTSDWKDIVNEHCGIETELPEGTAAFEVTQEEFVSNSALELAKFYGLGGGASIGEAGLPLPRGEYGLTSGFEERYLNGTYSFHKGLDMAAPEGTPIYAVKDGVCSVPPYMADGWGNYVRIDHGDGLETIYGHMSMVAAIDGQTVSAGDLIGYVGNTGYSFGNHLHFEVRINNIAIDPLSTEMGPLILDGAAYSNI